MGMLKELLDRLKSDPSIDYPHFYVEDGTPPQFVQSEKHYLRVWLRAARINDVRRWTSKFHATVHGRFVCIDRLQGQREVMSIVAPDKAFEEMDPRNLDRFIVVNQPLLGPVPYRGQLAMDVALFSVAAADLAKPYLDLLAELTKTASVGFLTQVQPFVEPLRRGAETLLFNENRAHLEIGLNRTDTQLRTGNIVVARVPKGNYDTRDLHIDPQDYRLLDNSGRPITSFPYMILGVEASIERDDYPTIPEIRTGWESVRQTASEGRPVEEVRQRFDQLRRAIYLSQDLIQPDKKRIVEIFNREISDAGYDVAPPREIAALEAMPAVRPLREAAIVLEGLRPVRAFEAIAAPGRISMRELQEMMRDPDLPDAELRKYFTANPDTARPFAPSIVPDPERVEVSSPADDLEGAMIMSWANGLCRLRRQEKFKRRQKNGDRRIVLVSEGDSWFQFPIFLDDVIDQLFNNFNIWSVDAAGDTLQNMVLDNAEYMQALRRNKDEVRAFLFSGGGNDIVGEDISGRPVISQIIQPFAVGRPPEWYLETEAFAKTMRFIETCYRAVIENVAAEFPDLPVICHGYDYAIPGGGPDDPRNPFWAAKDKWIGRAMREDLRITDPLLQRNIVKLMIDRLNERLKSLCGANNPNGAFRNAWHIDVRGTVGSLWADELHPTNEGFRLVAARALSVLRSALGAREYAKELALMHGSSLEALADQRPMEDVSKNTGDDADVDSAERAPDWESSPFEAAGLWRVAKSLMVLRRQVDAVAPSRRKDSDGTIGDLKHAARNSDHNPWVVDGTMGVVTALDITHDPDGGCNAEAIAEAIKASCDIRIKYIIWNRRIASSSIINAVNAWEWRDYPGSNPHTKHVHISVKAEKIAYDSEDEWRV